MSTDAIQPQPDSVPPHIRKRWDVFRKVFRETGSIAAACAAASPHLDQPKDATHGPGYRTILGWIKRYPEIAAEHEEDRFHALGNVEKALAERSMTPERVPVFSRGQLMGWREVWRDANALLLRRAARLDPNAWAQRTQADVRVEHSVTPSDGFTVALTAADVLLLPPEKRALFVELLSQIRDRKEERNAREVIDAQPVRPALRAGGADEPPDSDGGGRHAARREDQGGDRDGGGD